MQDVQNDRTSIQIFKIRRIPYQEVAAACQDESSSRFNTSFHGTHDGTPRPSEHPYSFSRWLPLIIKTRGLDPRQAQIVHLSKYQANLVLNASAASVITGEIHRGLKEELEEELLSISNLQYPPEGLFMRLDGCSPKDGGQTRPGVSSLHCLDDIIHRLTTSQRAQNDLRKSLQRDVPSIDITFLPFNGNMIPDHEYRVYCPPGNGKIAAISQYRWHKPWALSTMEEVERTFHTQNILKGVLDIHQQILQDLHPTNNPTDKLFLGQGFSFDVFYNIQTGGCELVELNVFGASSACGSCLFHWLEDIALLYGDVSEIEFRTTW